MNILIIFLSMHGSFWQHDRDFAPFLPNDDCPVSDLDQFWPVLRLGVDETYFGHRQQSRCTYLVGLPLSNARYWIYKYKLIKRVITTQNILRMVLFIPNRCQGCPNSLCFKFPSWSGFQLGRGGWTCMEDAHLGERIGLVVVHVGSAQLGCRDHVNFQLGWHVIKSQANVNLKMYTYSIF